MPRRLRQWLEYLCTPVDAASLAVVRIVLGAMIAWDVVRYFQTGWISEYYILPKWYFPYLYLEWVRPWPGQWMYAHFAAMLVVALLVAVGLYYRTVIVLLFLTYTYVFLLDKSTYMNHYYLISLLCFLFIWMQPHREFSLDRWRHPELPQTVPRWNVLLLRAQLLIVYFYGAIAKLNPDWLAGEPMYSEIVRHGPDVPAIAYHFPPVKGSSGVQRTLRFAQHLPRFGWRPIVLTITPKARRRYMNSLFYEHRPSFAYEKKRSGDEDRFVPELRVGKNGVDGVYDADPCRNPDAVKFDVGSAGYREAGVTHQVTNPGSTPMRVIEVELK